ncbi:prepilin-type N-terminal cleavage/methylation domain-containing protein [Candidatus Babeliales bacterium]|nr:prepilin-type N-terminal cleavage/methylation domain-containing protein [Candidatus Babeliales bacterium]MCF7899662.1 prepilin-type N-terminal cleavage/methylation domain-containing protein [Candidatus Babeliales bacterium]
MKNYAFSLIELMIVVAIIAFLATISIPKYFSYYAKAKQAEVAINLASLHTAQQSYWAEHGKYTNALSGPDSLNWKPQGNFNYTYGFNFSGAQEGVNFFTGKLKAPKDSLGQTNLTEQGFVAGAAADITGKNKMDLWQIDQDRNIEHKQNGLE